MRSPLLASLAMVAVLVAGGCSRKSSQRQDAARIAPAGAETWIVDDVPYQVKATHYERGASNAVTYVMTYPIPPGSATDLDKDGAGSLAWPLVKYAYNNRTFERAKGAALGGAAPSAINLAIDLYAPKGDRFLIRYEVPAGK